MYEFLIKVAYYWRFSMTSCKNYVTRASEKANGVNVKGQNDFRKDVVMRWLNKYLSLRRISGLNYSN